MGRQPCMAPRCPCTALAPACSCTALRRPSRMAAAPRIMALRRPCMTAAALLPRVGPGIQTTPTHRHGLRKNMSMPLMMSLPHPHRPMGAPPTPKHLATQTPRPRRSTHSTTHRLQGHQPCESIGASPYQLLPKPSRCQSFLTAITSFSPSNIYLSGALGLRCIMWDLSLQHVN